MSDRVPIYMDIAAMCENLCASEGTIDNWVRQGFIPPPRIIGGKRLWKTSAVIAAIDGETPNETTEDIAATVYKATVEASRRYGRKRRSDQ